MEILLKYSVILVLLVMAELLYFKLADRFNIIDKPNLRSSHTRITLRGGGIVFYFGVLLFFCLGGWLSGSGDGVSGSNGAFEYQWFMLALTLITGISFADDVRPMPQWLRLVVHFTAMGLLFYECGITGWPWWWMVLALIVCTGIINAYNFMDGINGITGGYSLVILGALAYVNQAVVPFINPNLLYTVLCSVMVFNFFNFRKKAKCFAGDVGSVGIAFVILFLLGSLVVKTLDFSWIVMLAVYGVDSIFTIIHRLMLRENIGEAHRKHMYQIMANELKIPHTTVSIVYMGVQGVIILGYFSCPDNPLVGYLYLILVVAFLGGVYVWFMKKYFKLHQK